MSQSNLHPTLSLWLTPMQLPEANPHPGAGGAGTAGLGQAAIAPTGPNLDLLVRPGEPSEILVQLRSQGQRWQLRLEVTGDFPQEWCRIGIEGSEVLPGQSLDAVLYFLIPEDFFEAQQSLHPQQSLKLNYRGQLSVYCRDLATGLQYMEGVAFNLYLRPYSLYLDFLPALYREVDFVGRFLKIFEQGFEPAVQILDTLWAYLDPLTAPQSLLPFLAHWVAWPMQFDLSLEQQRHLIRRAIDIYRWRGTRRGLRFYLHLATGLPLDEHLPQEDDKHIGIYEFFSQGFVLGAAQLEQDTILGGGRPFHFQVQLRPEADHPIDPQLIHQVIEQEKPAFCTYDLWIESRSSAYAPEAAPESPGTI